METEKIESILVPVYFLESDNYALKTAVSICKKNNAVLTLIHVAEHVVLLDTRGFHISLADRMTDFFKQLKQDLFHVANRILEDSQIRITCIVDAGKPEEIICKVARNNEYSMIILGTNYASQYGQNPTTKKIYQIVKNAPCPVVSVRTDGMIIHYNKTGHPLNQHVFENAAI